MRFAFDPTEIYEGNAETGWFVANARRADGLIIWTDLSHVRVVEAMEILVDTNDEFSFKSPRGRVYLFRRLTLDGYRRRIRPRAGGDGWPTLDALKSAVREAIALAG